MNKFSINTFCFKKKLVIFFVFFYGISSSGIELAYKVNENENYRFITDQQFTLSINKITKKYIFSNGKVDIYPFSKNFLQIKASGKKGFYFFNFNISDKKNIKFINYKLVPYRGYSSTCSLFSDYFGSKKNVEQLADLDKSIAELVKSESTFDKETCSQLADDYQPQLFQKRALINQFTFKNSNLIKCIDSDLVQSQIQSNPEVSKVFDNLHNQFGKLYHSIQNNKNELKIKCSSDDKEVSKVNFSENGIQISINFKKAVNTTKLNEYLAHELIHVASISESNGVSINRNSNIVLTEKVECICTKYTKIDWIKKCLESKDNELLAVENATTISSSTNGSGFNVNTANQNANQVTGQETLQALQNSPAVQNFQPVSSSTIATLANETLRAPSGTVVAQGYSGPILQQGSFDNAARAVANSFAPLMNTVAASITRLEAQTTPSGNSSAAAPQATGASTLKSATSRTSSVSDVGGAVVVSNEVGGTGSSSSAGSSVASDSGRAALALGQQAASKMTGETPAASTGEVRKSINSKMSGETVAANGGGQVASASSGRGVDSGGETSSLGGNVGGESANLVRQPASDPKTFTPGRAVVILNTLSSIKGNMYKATKEYYSNDNFKEGLRINGIQIQDGAQVLGSTQKPKKIFIDDGQSLNLQKK